MVWWKYLSALGMLTWPDVFKSPRFMALGSWLCPVYLVQKVSPFSNRRYFLKKGRDKKISDKPAASTQSPVNWSPFSRMRFSKAVSLGYMWEFLKLHAFSPKLRRCFLNKQKTRVVHKLAALLFLQESWKWIRSLIWNVTTIGKGPRFHFHVYGRKREP